MLLALLFAPAAHAAGSCVMGPAPQTVKVFFAPQGAAWALWFEGDEAERVPCSKLADPRADLRLDCGDDPEEFTTLLVKGSQGLWLDGQGEEIATLRQCRLR